MKTSRFLLILLFIVSLCSTSFAKESEGIYKHWGNYNYTVVPGLRVYYPESIKEAIPRIITSFSKVRNKIILNFPNEKDYIATVILDEHDDIVESSVESKFDLINLCIFDEVDNLSARSYSLEKRFALLLSKTLVKRATSNVSFQWRRSLAMLSIPQWFIEGMALNYAFSMDSIHYSRLLDMARYGRLYSLDELNTIFNQPLLVKEEMLFQAHSMLAYWESTYKKGADLEVVSSIVRNFRGFDKSFKKYYGVSLNEAYNSYVNYILKQGIDYESFFEPDYLDVDYVKNDAKIFRSYLRISDNERIWVSSKRYTTENYDLYYRKGIEKPKLLMKNVHPSLIYDSNSSEVILGKYIVNGRREKRLNLYSVNLNGEAKCLASEGGSFKPLGIKNNRIYYINVRSGLTKILSLDLKDRTSSKIELSFDYKLRPLDFALDVDKNKLYYTFQTVDFITQLAAVPLDAKNIEKESKIILRYDGDVRALKIYYGKLWCACDRDHSTTQLFCLDEDSKLLKKYSSLPGGVWDISFSDQKKEKIEVSSLYKGSFCIVSLPIKEEKEKIAINSISSEIQIDEELLDIKNNKYKTEYSSSLWKPVLGRDSEGSVLGIYNYRSDRLDRSNIMIAPTYGLKSHDWGYTSNFMRRFDLLKASVAFNDYTEKRDYMETEYYERVRSKKVQVEYPLKLDMKLSFGFDLVDRGIARIDKSPRNLIPTAGKDNYYFLELSQKSIRTEPYNNIFPRKGRLVDFVYKYGTDSLFGGDMIYDSMSIKWNEYVPLNDYYVLGLSCWLAQDDKHNNIRRPDDLYLGNNDYMRAFDSSYKSGDKLRYFSLALSRPIRLVFPKQISWLQNEFSALGVFWEMGDTRNEGKFDYDYDRGVEFSSSFLIFKRLPISFTAGYAKRNGQDGHGSYCNLFIEALNEMLNN